MTNINLPNSLTYIGHGAFYACGLQNIKIHDNITGLGNNAFANCSALTSVEIGKNVASIGSCAFDGCLNLTKIVVDKDNTEYSNDAYGALFNKNKTELIQYPIGNSCTSYSLPITVRTIDSRAFEDCTQLKEITIHKNVTSIGMSAFSNCKNIDKVYIEDLTAWCNIDFYNTTSNPLHDKLGSSDYYSATSLYLNGEIVTNLVIPDDVTTIKKLAFNGASIFAVTIKGNVRDIGEYAFGNCEYLHNITIEPGVTSIGIDAFVNTPYYNHDENWENGVLYIDNYLIRAEIPDSTTTYDIKTDTLCIADGALSSNSLVNITIPNSVTNIGMGAFGGCKKLTNITIPSNVTSIGDYTFYNCSSLKSITIPENITSIGDWVFYECTSLTSITVDSNNKNYSSDSYGVLFNKDKTELIQYPIGNKRTTYSIPGSVTSIGERAFCDCFSLTSVTIGNSVTSIGDWAFLDCSSLTNVTIGNSVISIGEFAFRNCTSLTSITIPDSVTIIGYGAFYKCASLTSITIPDSVTSIGVAAFGDCTGLTNAAIGNGVTSISLDTFGDCSNLNSVTIGNGVTTIITAFRNCDKLTDIYYNGTQEEWNAISIVYYLNKPLLLATIHFIDDEPSHTHSYTSSQINPTCTQPGSIIYTCSCSDTYTETINPTGHSFDGTRCTKCGYDRSTECTCNCHKGGISGFFFKLINFFQKLFGNNKVCACGKVH